VEEGLPRDFTNYGASAEEAIRQQEPTFLYHCGWRTLPPPAGYYWRVMLEKIATTGLFMLPGQLLIQAYRITLK